MQITTEKLEENQLLLNIQVEEEVIEKSMDQAYRRLVQRTNIPGFRRGKAPRSMVERFVGRTALLEDALERLLPDLAQKAMDEEGIKAVAKPRIEVVQVDPVIFKAVVPLPPTVELPDYRQIRVSRDEPVVSEEDVQKFLEGLRWDASPWEPAERPAKRDDLATVDIRAQEGDTQLFEREGVSLQISEETKEPAPGLAGRLTGMEKGARKDFRISYPADYPDQTWAGREADFQVHVTEIKEKRLPVLDDEFAKGIGDGYESLDALRQFVRGRMEERARLEAQNKLENEVVQALVAGATVEFPPVFAQQEAEILANDLSRQLERQGISLAQYLKFTNKSEEEFLDDMLPRAKERVKRRLVLDKVSEVENFEASVEEVEAEIEEAVRGAGAKEQELRGALGNPGGRAPLEQMIKTRKALARLVELATAEEAEPETADQAPVEETASQGEGAVG
ncbi:MAG: trigger factor [Dehalococcoidia bacterium]|nr:trigger factor [Dehalococcoidia bacterium]